MIANSVSPARSSLSGGGRPAHQRWHRTRHGSDDQRTGRVLLHRGIDRRVRHKRQQAQPGGEQIHDHSQPQHRQHTPSDKPSDSAMLGSRRPAGSGRFLVRSARPSMSRSRYMFSALAPPTRSDIPMRSPSFVSGGGVCGARYSPTTPVATTMSVMRGLTRATMSQDSTQATPPG